MLVVPTVMTPDLVPPLFGATVYVIVAAPAPRNPLCDHGKSGFDMLSEIQLTFVESAQAQFRLALNVAACVAPDASI